jgi:cation-transporting ATPase 13A3/4/5
MIQNRKELWPHLASTYGETNASAWYYRWQIFFMACAELFAYEGGDTWGISQLLFQKSAS